MKIKSVIHHGLVHAISFRLTLCTVLLHPSLEIPKQGQNFNLVTITIQKAKQEQTSKRVSMLRSNDDIGALVENP